MRKLIFNHWDCKSESNQRIYHIVGNVVNELALYLLCVCIVYFGYARSILLIYLTLLELPSLITILHYIIKAIYLRIQSDSDKYDTFYEEKRKELSGHNMRKLHRLVKRKGKLKGTIYIKFPRVYLVCGFHIYKFKIMVLSHDTNKDNLYFDVECGHFDIPGSKTKWEVEITEDDFVDIDE